MPHKTDIAESAEHKAVVVVVDGEDARRCKTVHALINAGYQVVEGRTGSEALEAAAAGPALVVLNAQLPDMSGFDVCRLLKSDKRTSRISVLHVSSTLTESEHMALALSMGADGYLTHPVAPQVLIATVRAIMHAHAAESGAFAAAYALSQAYREQKRIAEMLQRSLLINTPADAYPGLQLATFYEAAWDESMVGGDFYDTFRLADGRVALVVGDTTGKGLAAATRTAEVKFALRAYMHEHEYPARVMERLNDFLCDTHQSDNHEDTMVALAIALVDLSAGEVTVAAAGAEPPLILGSDGSTRQAAATGVPLGAFRGLTYIQFEMALEEGDTIIMATDGVTEARRNKEFLSYEGMVDLARVHVAGTQSLSEAGGAMLSAARKFAQDKFQDDVCILLARRESE